MDATELTCTICGQTKPLDSFTPNKASRLGRMKQCKECRNARERARHEADPQKQRDRRNAYRRGHPEVRERERAYEDAMRERRNARQRERRGANNDRYLERERAYRALDAAKWTAYGRAHRADHPEMYRAAVKRWRMAHPDQARAAYRDWQRRNSARKVANNRAYRQRHPSAAMAMTQRRKARKLGAEGSFTAREWRALQDFYNNTCLRCGNATRRLTADHVVPLARGGSNYIADLQPLCRSCNSFKGLQAADYRTRPLEEFLVFLKDYPYLRRPKGWRVAGVVGHRQ